MVICGRRYARSKPVGPERESELPASAKPFHCTPKSARGPYCDRLVRQQIGRDNRDRSYCIRRRELPPVGQRCPQSDGAADLAAGKALAALQRAFRLDGRSKRHRSSVPANMMEGWVNATRHWCYLRLTIYAARSAASDRDSAMSGIFGCGSSKNKAILAASKSDVFAIVANGGA